MFDTTEKYRHVRGFNFQPDWGSHGITVWLKFDHGRYRELIKRGKEKFPGLNTLRVWLSLDAWCEDRAAYLGNVEKAGKIITEENLSFIPVYFNGWFGMPSFGGFTPETLGWAVNNPGSPYAKYLRETAERLSGASVLMSDIANEPFNGTNGCRHAVETVTDFLKTMASELKKIDARPLTVGSQGMPDLTYAEGGHWSDIDLLDPFVDVFSLHPYCIPPMTDAAHEDYLGRLIAYINKKEKSAIITECCWAGKTDDERIKFLETELPHYAKAGLGFLCHALCVSPVSDLHPLDDENAVGLGLYMAFLDKNGNIRKGHDIFNRF